MFILSFATNVYFYIENQNLLHNLAYKELHEADKAGDLHAKSRAVGKIAGFTQAHIDRYGPIPPGALEIDNP